MPTITKRSYVKAASSLWCDIKLTVNETSTSTSDNSSTISYSYSAKQRNDWNFSGTTRNPAGTVSIIINGKTVKTDNIGLIRYGVGSCSGSGTVTVPHNSDGTKTMSYSIKIDSSSGNYSGDTWVYSNASVSSKLTLTKIPRNSTIESISATKLGSTVTVNFKNYSSSYYQRIYYKFEGMDDYKRVYTGTGTTSQSFTIPIELANNIPTKMSGNCSIALGTYTQQEDGTKIGHWDYKDVKISVPSYGVKFDPIGVARIDNTVPSDWGVYVQGYSQVSLEIPNATTSYGASIKSYKIEGPYLKASTANATSTVLKTSGDLTYTCTVTDSRGRTGTRKVTIHVEPYKKPSVTFTATRCYSDGTPSVKGQFVLCQPDISYSTVAGHNATKYCGYTCNGVGRTTNSDTANAIISAKLQDMEYYTVTCKYSDLLNPTSYITATQKIGPATRIFNVAPGGMAIGLGCFANQTESATPIDTTTVSIDGATYILGTVYSKAFFQGKQFTLYDTGSSTMEGAIAVVSQDQSATGRNSNVERFGLSADKNSLYFLNARDSTVRHINIDKTSDLSIKNSIIENNNLDKYINNIKNIQFFDFCYNDDMSQEENGYIANQLETVDKRYVNKKYVNDDTNQTILQPNYETMYRDSIRVLQYYINKVDELEKRIDEMEKRV